jgi:Leucine-rich repeat (LRR) protein
MNTPQQLKKLKLHYAFVDVFNPNPNPMENHKILFDCLIQMTNLTHLDMSETNFLNYNSLKDNEQKCEMPFGSFINLKELKMESNNIEYLNPKWFEKMQNLEYLSLNENCITSLDFNDDFLFLNLRNLKKLSLNRNNNSKISSRTFKGLIRLKYLDLSECVELKELDENAFRHFDQ